MLTSNASSIMDTGDNKNLQLEAEYVTLFGSTVARCVEELIVLCQLLADDTVKENSQALQQFRVALDRVAIETKGVGLLSSMNDGEQRVKLVGLLSSDIKK